MKFKNLFRTIFRPFVPKIVNDLRKEGRINNQILEWLRNGCLLPPPQIIEQISVGAFKQKFGYATQIKSGILMDTIQLNNITIKIPYISGILCKVEEPWMLELLKKIFELKSGPFIDVGVNLGQTLIQAKSLDLNRRYVGFEPNPNCSFYLEHLIKANNFSDCMLVPAGIFTQDSLMKLDLYCDDITDSSASIVSNFRDSGGKNRIYRSIIVPVFRFETIDEALHINDFDVLKVDVEGAELEVLITLRNALIKNNPIIILEVLPAYSIDNIKRVNKQDAIMKLMDELNYMIYRIEKSKDNKFSRINRIENFGVHSDLNMCDYVLVPRNESSEVEIYLNPN